MMVIMPDDEFFSSVIPVIDDNSAKHLSVCHFFRRVCKNIQRLCKPFFSLCKPFVHVCKPISSPCKILARFAKCASSFANPDAGFAKLSSPFAKPLTVFAKANTVSAIKKQALQRAKTASQFFQKGPRKIISGPQMSLRPSITGNIGQRILVRPDKANGYNKPGLAILRHLSL